MTSACVHSGSSRTSALIAQAATVGPRELAHGVRGVALAVGAQALGEGVAGADELPRPQAVERVDLVLGS